MCLKTKRLMGEYCLDNGSYSNCKDCQIKKGNQNLEDSNSWADRNFCVVLMILSPNDEYLMLFKDLEHTNAMLIIRMRDFKLLKEVEFNFVPRGLIWPTPDSKYLFMSNSTRDKISKWDLHSYSVISTSPVLTSEDDLDQRGIVPIILTLDGKKCSHPSVHMRSNYTTLILGSHFRVSIILCAIRQPSESF